MQLVLRRANLSRRGGPWQHEDFDVLDGERDVGRIFQQADSLPLESETPGVVLGGLVSAHPAQELRARRLARRAQGGVPGRV
jgi:hypothetical protein